VQVAVAVGVVMAELLELAGLVAAGTVRQTAAQAEAAWRTLVLVVAELVVKVSARMRLAMVARAL